MCVPVRNFVQSQDWPPLTRKVQRCHSLWHRRFISGTSYSEFISPTDSIPWYQAKPGRRAMWEAPRVREPTYQVGIQLQKTLIPSVSHPSAGILALTLVLVWPGHFPQTSRPISLQDPHHTRHRDSHYKDQTFANLNNRNTFLRTMWSSYETLMDYASL